MTLSPPPPPWSHRLFGPLLNLRIGVRLALAFSGVFMLMRISANVTGDFGNVTGLGLGAGLRA